MTHSVSRHRISLALSVCLLMHALLHAGPAFAVDVHFSPRFWYALESLSTGESDKILEDDIRTVINLDHQEVPLVGFSILFEAELDVIVSFFWGQAESDFAATSVLTEGVDSVLEYDGKLDAERYDVELLVRWRPRDRPIYVFTGLRYYRLEYVLESDRTVRIPQFDTIPPPLDQTLNPLPDTRFTNNLVLWQIGGGFYIPISDDAQHRLIAGGQVGIGYNRFTVERDEEPFFANLPDPTVYARVDEAKDEFAVGWDVNFGYQWQFHRKFNLVTRYRAFGKTSATEDSKTLGFIVSHGPEIGVGYHF